MTGQRHLAAVPGRYEQQVLDWLSERETADAGRSLESAFDELANVRQLRPWPWTRLAGRLQPEPFGSSRARTVALVVAAALLLALLATTWLTVGHQPPQPIPAVVPPVATASASSGVTATVPPSVGPFPLASPAYAVIFDVDVGVDTGVFTMRTDGTGRHQVATELTGRLVSPEWGPDGTSALVLEQTTSSEQVWDVDTAGTRRPLVIIPCVAPCQSRNEASWSHDGTSIVFFQALGEVVNGIPTTCGLARYGVATLTITSVTSSPCAVIEERHARFSPDDASLAFWRSRSPGRVPIDQIEDSAIFTRDVATGRETQVTDWSIHASMLDWSPDGQWIAFIPDYWNSAADGADIWRVHPNGSGLERMTSLDTVAVQIRSQHYTPDGKWLLFLRITQGVPTGELLAIPASGGAPVQVLPGTNVLDFDVRAVSR